MASRTEKLGLKIKEFVSSGPLVAGGYISPGDQVSGPDSFDHMGRSLRVFEART
jgi:hypothetical protein